MRDAPLRLRAEDAEDLGVISAAVQDAIFQVGGIAYDRKARRFALALNRFRWEAARGGRNERVRSALAFEDVLGVRSRKLRRDDGEASAVLLSVSFEPAAEPPGGDVVLTLAGGGEIRLSVEALDAGLTDMGAPWPAARRPDHEQ